MKTLAFTLTAALCLAGSAGAETAIFPAEKGLSQVIAEYEAKPERAAAEQMGLATARFLHAIEKTLQARYRYNATMEDVGLPVLRLPVPPNPAPEPFDPGMVTAIFTGISNDMDLARTDLSAIPQDADAKLEVDLRTVWFDINANGKQDDGEDLLTVAATVLGTRGLFPGQDETTAQPVVRFDLADTAWLAAYTHLLSAISEMVIAFDPTDVIAEILTTTGEIYEMRGGAGNGPTGWLSRSEENYVDYFAIFYGAVNRQPDAERVRAARLHLLEMVSENRRFWSLVGAETDNDAEWIPNDNQTAALGFTLPQGTGATWLSVLYDAEAVLQGKLLVSHWRMSGTGGVNVAKLMQDPPAVDIVTWFQGSGLLPYLENGPTVSGQNLTRFERMISGDATLFMVLLN